MSEFTLGLIFGVFMLLSVQFCLVIWGAVIKYRRDQRKKDKVI